MKSLTSKRGNNFLPRLLFLVGLIQVGLMCSITSIGQSYDANWILANGQLIVEFHEEEPNLHLTDSIFNTHLDNSCISDSEGALWFYANGCSVRGWDYAEIMNGDSLNPGAQTDLQCSGGNVATQGSLFIPSPGNPNHLYLLHMNLDFFPPYGAVGIEFFYSLIDVSDGVNVRIIEKNHLVYADTFAHALISACRHANGRDWWLLIPEMASNKWFRFLLDANGLHGPWEQRVATVLGEDNGGGWVAFSEDGNFYARVDKFDNLHVLNFDRCSGLLSNHHYIKLPTIMPSLGNIRSLAFSPNSQLLYVNGPEFLYQFDLNAPSLQNSMQLVGEFDGYGDPHPGYFSRMKLAPDGKIYVFPGNSNYYLNVINKPDERGEDCDFVQHEFELPLRNYTYPPNIPNFKLGRMEGSPCDTLFVPPVTTAGCTTDDMQVNPNPFEQELFIRFDDCIIQEGRFFLYDALGRVIWEEDVHSSDIDHVISLPQLATGVYFYQIISEGKQLKSGKLLKY